MALNHPHLQEVLDYSCSTKSNFCSKHYIVKVYYKYIPNDLRRSELEMHGKNGTSFTHQELTHLAYQNLEALAYLHRNGSSYDDVRPEYIGLREEHSETMQCKNYFLCDRLANPAEANVVQVNHYLQGDNVYMCPKLWRGVTKGEKNIEHNSQKSDAWSLGMIVLEAGNGHEVQKVYDKDNKDINEEELSENLLQFKTKYGTENPLLYSIVENLLQVDESKRLSCVELLDKIPHYSDVKSSNEHHRYIKKEEVIVSSHSKPEVDVAYDYKNYEYKPTQFFEAAVVRREYIDASGNI